MVKEGQKVKAGDTVLVIEAMKMENSILAPVSGQVVTVFVEKGDSVKSKELLIDIHPANKK